MASQFLKLGSTITGATNLCFKTRTKQFKVHFGINPGTCKILHNRLYREFGVRVSRLHLLWSLYFLCMYPKVKAIRKLFGVDVKTFRKHTRKIIFYFKHLEVVSNFVCNILNMFSWEFQIKFSHKLKSLDGTDFRIKEPRPFSTKWWSFKFNGPGLRYEIALEIESGHIVWAYGGFPCGRYPDLKIARRRFVKLLKPNEKTIADKGYRYDNHFYHCKNGRRNNKWIKKILARHENANRRIKSFDCLSETFRHDLSLHHVFFHAVANIVQIGIENGEKLPDVSH